DRPAGKDLADDCLGVVAAGWLSIEKEEHADGKALLAADRASALESEAPGLFLEEGLRQLEGQPRSLARLAADAAAGVGLFEAEQGLANDLMRRPPLARTHPANPAGITTNFILIEEIP